MYRISVTASTLALCAGAAFAGGVERSTQSVGILFEKGTYAEFSLGSVSPSISGIQAIAVGPFPAGANSGNMAKSFMPYSLSFKTAISDQVDVALVIDQSIGANVNYPVTGYIYGGSTAEIKSMAYTAMLRYRLPSNVSFYGGLRLEQAEGTVALFNGYTMNTNRSTEVGYLLGVAYEKPEIALRVALTYNSAIDHAFSVQENGGPSLPFTTTVPQSVNLEFQTGIAPDTLLFGSIRWREWSAFDITPVGFLAATGSSLVSYADNTITYTLGVGRKFNENWSGGIQVGYEKANGGFSGNLGPTDGFTSIGAGVTYTKDKMKITGGVSYVSIGNAKTEAPAPFLSGTTLANFTDNHAVAFGIKIGYSF